jgi:hypothetical protein
LQDLAAAVDGKLADLLVLVEELLAEMGNQDLLAQRLVVHNLLVAQGLRLLMVMVEHYLVALNPHLMVVAAVAVEQDIMVVVLEVMLVMENLVVVVLDT